MHNPWKTACIAMVAFGLGYGVASWPRVHAQSPSLTNLVGWDVTIRNPGEKESTPKSPRFGLEVFQDRFGNLIYITTKGSVAVVPKATTE